MIQFDLPKDMSSIIKVIGVGGGGSNAVNHMYGQNIEGVNFIICNTDAQSIAQSLVPNKVQLGPLLTQGLGAGANPEIGRQAAEESLEDLRKMLETNTKMAFITAGMGGGTGTGGAPTIAKMCKELGILTVGIVTTPFSYEGKKRQLQAEEGIKSLKQYVDTLIIINNDKLRYQFGNLKWKEAFEKADNVLSTAAKCITDVINSTGQINVDFADVCTVMRNGGSAILGSATARGENRALMAIEEALSSPLLDDSDISGAKFILININSAEGEHEFTMDEVEVIQDYLRNRSGDMADVHLGMGYNNELGDQIGITLIATGFDRDNKQQSSATIQSMQPAVEEKIMMVLDMKQEAPVAPIMLQPQESLMVEEDVKESVEKFQQTTIAFDFEDDLMQKLEPQFVDEEALVAQNASIVKETSEEDLTTEETVSDRIEWVLSLPEVSGEIPAPIEENTEPVQATAPTSAASSGFLAKPTNIYAEPALVEAKPVQVPVQEVHPVAMPPIQEEESPETALKLVIKDEEPAAVEHESWAHPIQQPVMTMTSTEEPAMQDEVEEHKRRAAERIQKLRNLSFNVNAADPNNEFETVPAYVRRNLGLKETNASVENFYSNYEVRKDDNNNTVLSTINTFLEGNRPD